MDEKTAISTSAPGMAKPVTPLPSTIAVQSPNVPNLASNKLPEVAQLPPVALQAQQNPMTPEMMV